MNEIAQLSERLDRLESELSAACRRLRRWRCFTGGMAGLLAVGVLIAAAAQPVVHDVLRTHRLEVLDAEQNIVAAIESGEAGGQLDLWSDEGHNVLRAAVNDHGGDLILWNKSGSALFSAYAVEAGGEMGMWNAEGGWALHSRADEHGGRLTMHATRQAPYLLVEPTEAGGRVSVNDREGRSLAELRAAPAGGEAQVRSSGGERDVLLAPADIDSSVSLRSADAAPLWSVGRVEGGARMRLFNDDGTGIVSLAADHRGAGGLSLGDEAGRLALRAEASTADGAALSLFSEDGRRLAVLVLRPEGGLLNLMNAQGTPVVGVGAAAGGGGGFSLRNNAGTRVFHAGVDPEEHGTLMLWTGDGRTVRVVTPGTEPTPESPKTR